MIIDILIQNFFVQVTGKLLHMAGLELIFSWKVNNVSNCYELYEFHYK